MNVSWRVKTVGRRACESCLAGKMKESFNKKTNTRATVKGQRLHADTSGILPISIRKFRYFLLIVDDATRATWVRLLKTKSTEEIFPIIVEVKSEIEIATGNKIAEVRADNGKGEFGAKFQDHLKAIGIHFELYLAYKHSMNGVVERAIYIVDCKARSMLF